MKTDYASHEERYRQLREGDQSGWDDDVQRADHVDELSFYDSHLPPPGSLLELGCGAGDMALLYAARGFTVSGVDISETAIAWAGEKARAQGSEAVFRVGDVLALDWPDGSFDVVLDGHCLHCIIGDDRARFLAEARRVVKADGVVLIGTMCGDVTSPAILERYDPASRCMVRGEVATRYFGEPEAIVVEIEAAGLAVVDHRIKPRVDDSDQDMLLVVARRAGGR